MSDNKRLYSIGSVERDSGISRETLRVWERRYGYPKPQRNSRGERIYSHVQVRRLQRIKRLLDHGQRPAKLLVLSDTQLDALENEMLAEVDGSYIESVDKVMQAIMQPNLSRLDYLVQTEIQQSGLRRFITDTLVPLLQRVGDAWGRGELAIYQEHTLSQRLYRLIYANLSFDADSTGKVVILASLPSEKHGLGLLLVEAVLSMQGYRCINLGNDLSIDQLIRATIDFDADILGLTFSAAYPSRRLKQHIADTRHALPSHIDLWLGGAGVHHIRNLPDECMRFQSLTDLIDYIGKA